MVKMVKMDKDLIQREVERLAPWYYSFDLLGVRTDSLEAFDHHGHRTVDLPGPMRHLLEGRRILDVGCNEGAYSFAALECGAQHVTAFDCREVNIEKARLVADILGYDSVDFHVASCDSWLERSPEPVDWVILCGILYHLPEPWRTIQQYCDLAKEGMLTSSVLSGGEDGYTEFTEEETIGASEDPTVASMMPNTTRTLLAEFAKQRFHAVHINESRLEGHWGACGLLLRNCRRWVHCEPQWQENPADFGIGLVPAPLANAGSRQSPFDLDVVLYNLSKEARDVDGYLTVEDAEGRTLLRRGPQRLSFGPRVPRVEHSSSLTHAVQLSLPQGPRPFLMRADVTSPGTDRALDSASMLLYDVQDDRANMRRHGQ